MKRSFYLSVFIALLGFQHSVFAEKARADLATEISNYIGVFSGDDFAAQRRAMQPLSWSGISDPAIYDVVVEKLNAANSSSGKAAKEQASWYVKTLALSGNEKYRAVLQDVAVNSESSKVRGYAVKALRRLDVYSAWNPVISKGLAGAPINRLEETRIANMLGASDYELMRVGAKRVYYEHSNDKDLAIRAMQRLATEMKNIDQDNGTQIDAVAWLIKAVGQTRDAKGLAMLQDIRDTTKVKKFKKYAKKALK